MTPNDPKLSDCGARRGSCGVERREDIRATGEQRTDGTAASVEIAATVTRGAVRCSAWLGVSVIGLCRFDSEVAIGVGNEKAAALSAVS
jgi:hypothetical protein